MNIYSDQYKYSMYNCIVVLFSITEVLYVYVTWLVCMFVLYLGGNSTGIYSQWTKYGSVPLGLPVAYGSV